MFMCIVTPRKGGCYSVKTRFLSWFRCILFVLGLTTGYLLRTFRWSMFIIECVFEVKVGDVPLHLV